MNISVVITCFNRQRMIARAVRSALDQTLQPVEIVVVDDGSYDDSAIVALGMSDLVRVIRQPNAGAAAARNRGIDEAQGEWVAFLDSDDCWHPEKLSKQALALETHPEAQLSFCDVEVQREDAIEIASLFRSISGEHRQSPVDSSEFLDRSFLTELLWKPRIRTSAVVVRRELNELRFPESIWGADDWALWLKLALRYPFALVDDVLVTMHRQHDNLISHRTEARLLRNQVRVLLDLLDDSELSQTERQYVERTVREKVALAFQTSLARGERREARRLLRRLAGSDIGNGRQLAFWLTSYLPVPVANWMALNTSKTTANEPAPHN